MGFGFLTLAIVTGLLWSHAAHGRYWTWDAKEWSALVAWVIYVGLILARQRTGWGGRRAALLGIAGLRGRGLHLRLDERDRAPGRGAVTVIVVVGVSHRTAPLEVREALAFPRDRIAEALRARCARRPASTRR